MGGTHARYGMMLANMMHMAAPVANSSSVPALEHLSDIPRPQRLEDELKASSADAIQKASQDEDEGPAAEPSEPAADAADRERDETELGEAYINDRMELVYETELVEITRMTKFDYPLYR